MRRLLASASLALLLAGCSSGGLTPAQTLQDKTAVLVDEANAKDLPNLRMAIDDLRATIASQLQAGTITAARATALLRLLSAIERDAPQLTATPTPSPTVSPTPSPTPSATPSPTPSPTSSPTPSPTPPPTTAPPTTAAPTKALPTTSPPTPDPGLRGGHPSAISKP